MEVKILKPEERNYTYSQSQQISMQTGCIGHLRADMDTSGEGFFSSWDDFRKDLKTQEFKDEFDELINELRKEGGFLKNRTTLAKFCNTHPEASFGKDVLGKEREFGVRVNTDSYAYMMRLNPHKGEYNLYCYCYRKDWLDSHLEKATNGIRFIDSSYNELFKIKDGEKIIVTTAWDEKSEYTCRYIDEYHTEIGNNLYHICEFAERMEQNKATYEPKEKPLPDMCYSVLPSSCELIVINQGEQGYRPYTHQFADRETNREMCSQMNKNLGVSKAQEAAMLAGSMFGWTCPAANPKSYDGNGTPINPKQKDRGDAR